MFTSGKPRDKQLSFLGFLVMKLEVSNLYVYCYCFQTEWGPICCHFGLGAVGLAAAKEARVSGASRIIDVNLNPSRFKEDIMVNTQSGASRIIDVNLNPSRFKEAKKFGLPSLSIQKIMTNMFNRVGVLLCLWMCQIKMMHSKLIP